ncbi:hypothetical protein IC614_03045 [Allosphingosinicella flava]|uniref:Uncharacterized protein n=1 Tax=Allosphingosinicella flava TaxID=2771430 RepID=A0A7T2GL90_9SPHN|nr:hypothetical protein [Sphingosinicella flava]QPQ55593.1 hypothetical protein IC614_03045 [Sphingosinicella flava]
MRSGIGNSASDPFFVSVAGGTGTGGATQVEGNAASGATDTGNPVKIGAKYVGTAQPAALTAGQRSDARVDRLGRLLTFGQGARTYAHGQVTIGTTPTVIAVMQDERGAITIINHGTTDVFIGGAAVSTGNGALLAGSKGASITIPTIGPLYGIVGTGTQLVSYLETY